MQTLTKTAPNSATVLGKAFMRAADRLGIPKSSYNQIIGRDRSTITRKGIDPTSKAGELCAVFIRCYRSLAVMVNDNEEQMRHWFYTENRHLNGIPAEQIQSVDGLVNLCHYLDAIRGKV